MFQVLDTDGTLVGPYPPLSIQDLHAIYRLMVRARAFDRKALSLQRQGRIGTYPPLEGQEGAQIGSALALDPEDWVYPSYREHGVQLVRGMPMEVILAYWKGIPNPAWAPGPWRMGYTTVPIASQIPHAVGHAYQERLAGRSTVVMAYFGDGATSESDFHAGLNFAGVWNTPTVFFCQNNQYAISTPRHRQTASETIAQKADAYGMPGIQVDGNDLFAVVAATSSAVARARDGGGASLIEAVTFRIGPHTTTDDPGRYRDPAEEEQWKQRDPLDRVRRYLETAGEWTSQWQDELEAAAGSEVEAAIGRAEALAPLDSRGIFAGMFAEVPPHLDRQHEMLEGRFDG